MPEGISSWAVFRIFVYSYQQLKKLLFRKPIGYFLSPENFYGQFLGARAKKISITHETECLGRDNELADALGAVDSGQFTVLHFTAPPGHGKSRFALELSRRLRGKGQGVWWFLGRWLTGRRWKVYFVREHASSVSDHVTELRSSYKLAVFIDNAHEAKETIRELASYARMTVKEGKILLICLSRSTLKNVVSDALSGTPMEEVKSVTIRKLSEATIENIVKAQLPSESEKFRKRIVTFASDSVFLTIHICQLVRRNVDFSESISDELFRRKICDAPIEEAVGPCAIATYKAIRAATVLSAAAPVDCNDEAIRKITCELADISNVDYQCLLDQLTIGALFSKYGKSMVRPIPDLIGALLIDNACISDGVPNEFAAQLLKALLPRYSGQALDSLSDLGWTLGTSEAIDIVGPVIASETKAINSENPSGCRRVMEAFGPLSLRRSNQVVGYIQEAWTKTVQAIESDADNAKEWMRAMGDAVPMLGAATNNDDTAEAAMFLLKEMVIREGVDTRYDNHKPQTILTESIGFSTSRTVTQTSHRMSIVERWFEAGGADAAIALRSLDGILSTTIQWTESEAFSISFKTTSLNLSEMVRGVRERGINLIIQGLGSSEVAVQDAAFFASSQIGSYRGGGASDEAIELVESEKSRVIGAIKELIGSDETLRIYMQAERRLWEWWRMGSDELAQKCESVLRSIKDDATYRIGKYIYSSQLPLSKISHILDADISLDRNHRFFSDKREESERTKEHLVEMFSEIRFDDDPLKWKAFLNGISDDNCKAEWRASQVLSGLGEVYPDTAWTLIDCEDDALWANYKGSMLWGARLADQTRWDDNLLKVLEEPT